ncbi:MAG: transposase [Patescibacteria group bacterium]|mgnify:CR=1 FL=1
MPYRKEQFVNGDIYHITNRAIDDNLIFKDKNDYYRGIFSIYEFNNEKPVNISNRRRDRIVEKEREKPCETGSHAKLSSDEREKLVDIFAFCFMPNHIHLLVKQLEDNGITNFMKKVGIGYGGYFNRKYQRKGYVFQNRFKSVHIENDNQFMVVVPYIFTNPTALIEPGWKGQGIKNHSTKEVLKFLEEYKWSSYQDCIGIKNFDSVTQRDFLLEMMAGKQGCKDAVENWIKNKVEIGQHANILLD